MLPLVKRLYRVFEKTLQLAAAGGLQAVGPVTVALVPETSKSMMSPVTSPGGVVVVSRVYAWLFQKMLLKSATGFEKSGDPGGRLAWNTGEFASEVRPAECWRPSVPSEDDVETFSEIVLLMIRTLDESSSRIAPPKWAAPLSTIMLPTMSI